MRDEGFDSPHGVLNVSRNADLEAVEATFARLYKAARRQQRESDHRRQELNGALEVLRDPERRAKAEIDWYHVLLDRDEAVPTPEALASELLPVELVEPESAIGAVPVAGPLAVIDGLLGECEPVPWPERRELLRRLAARVALERLDPWES